MVISANWMTLGFANAKRNVQAPARDPSENGALAARNFAEPFSCEAPAARGLRGGGGGAAAAAAGQGRGRIGGPALSGASYGRVDASCCPTPFFSPQFFHLMPPCSRPGSRSRSPRGQGGTRSCLLDPPPCPPPPTRAPPRRECRSWQGFPDISLPYLSPPLSSPSPSPLGPHLPF